MVQAIEMQIKILEEHISSFNKQLGDKYLLFEKMERDYELIEFDPKRESSATTLKKNINIVLGEITMINMKISSIRNRINKLQDERLRQLDSMMSGWSASVINPFGNPRLAGILNNPFLVSPATG